MGGFALWKVEKNIKVEVFGSSRDYAEEPGSVPKSLNGDNCT